MTVERIQGILKLAGENDQLVRKTLGLPTSLQKNQDETHTYLLQQILDMLGCWPSASLVGKEASESAWLLVQHSNNLDFQKSCVLLIQKCKDTASRPHLAYLMNTIAIKSGRKQLFGTSVITTKSKTGRYITKAALLKDPKNVDKRRKKYGLPPLAEYLKQAQEVFERYHANKT